MMNRLLVALFASQLIIALLVGVFVSKKFAVSFEVLFVATLLIMAGSFQSYRRLVERSASDNPDTYRDTIDKIEDPFDLYDEDDKSEELQSLNELKIRKVKPRHFKNAVRTKSGFFGLGRLLAYLLFIVALFALKNNAMLNLWGVGAGVTTAVIAVLIYVNRLQVDSPKA